MKVLVIGAGLSGCSLARLLVDRGHDVQILEKQARIGGLCITEQAEDGLRYEPYGPRVLHSRNPWVIAFCRRFGDFNGYVHRKGMILEGSLFPFPLTRSALARLRGHERIRRELAERPATPDRTNFETACVSLFGRTLYALFIENYTRKMWGLEPAALSARWAPARLEFREDETPDLFPGQFQGLPREGYSRWLERMVEGIPVNLGATVYEAQAYDVVVSSAPVDETMGHALGHLPYRSLRYTYRRGEAWEHPAYGTINLPQHPRFIRKGNFNVLHGAPPAPSLVQYQEAVSADAQHLPMYPVHTRQSAARFEDYVRACCRSRNLCPHGRLGLFAYLDMDRALELSRALVPVVEQYAALAEADRYTAIHRALSQVGAGPA